MTHPGSRDPQNFKTLTLAEAFKPVSQRRRIISTTCSDEAGTSATPVEVASAAASSQIQIDDLASAADTATTADEDVDELVEMEDIGEDDSTDENYDGLKRKRFEARF